MCPDWLLNTALVGSAVRTLTEVPGNQGVANRVGTVRTVDPTGFHQSGHMSIDRLKEGRIIFPCNSRVRVFQGLLHISSDPLINYSISLTRLAQESMMLDGFRSP